MEARLTDDEIEGIATGGEWESLGWVADAQLRKALWWASGNKLLSGSPGPLYDAGWYDALDAIKTLATEAGIDPWPTPEDVIWATEEPDCGASGP